MTAPHPALTPDFVRLRVLPHLTPADWNRRFLPHYGFGLTPGADFHGDLSADLDGLHRRRGSRRAYIAPRGGAKSTWVTLAYVLRCAVQGWEPHVILLSDSDEQAVQHLGAVKAELEANPRLAAGYPDAVGPGPEWRLDRLRLPNGVLIEAMGRGVRIRGRKNRQARPSLVVLDDVQSNRDTVSAVERQRAWDWFSREVIPAGDERTNFVSVGTALHREAVAVRALALPGWVGRTFRAVHEWPLRTDLWEEWERLSTNLTDEHRVATAAAFFDRHRAEMAAGFRGYWDAKWPVERLMAVRAEVGARAFDAEYQGNPATPEGAEWPAEYFDRPGFWFDQFPPLVVKLQAIDPSKGTGSKSADYQAHVWGGLAADGMIYLDADLRREADYVSRMLDIAHEFRPQIVVAESNNTMGLLAPQVEYRAEERRLAGRPLTCGYEEVYHTTPKAVRVRAVGPYLTRRQVRVRRTPGGRMLVDQWRDFPNGEHDDACDAAGTLIRRLEQLVT